MCGIAGIVAYRESEPPVESAELRALARFMAKRGPDGEGLWISQDRRAGFSHRRLAIIDLTDGGSQPMCVDGLCVTYNGEIYNYRKLREELLAQGVVFRSESDTEVLLHLYRRDGAAMVERLRGMYAFAIWDEANRTLFAARDPFGIKPLYYADSGGTVRFASQVKALVATKKVGTEAEPAGHVGFFLLGSVPEPFTMYESIKALPAGCILTVKPGRTPRVDQYFNLGEEFQAATALGPVHDQREIREVLATALKDTVAHHMVSDVPVGVFLSSGLDSSTIASLAREVKGSNLHSVTLGFEEYRGTANDETVMAAATASQLGTIHATRWINRDAFDSELERVVAAMDQPTIDGVNTYFVSKVAAESGMKVALSGLGGDELFGGYPSFRDVPRMLRTFRLVRGMHRLGRLTRRATAPLLRPFVSPKFAGLLEYGSNLAGAYLLRRALYMPWEVEGLLDPKTFEIGWKRLALLDSLDETARGIRSQHQQISALELAWYMRNQLLRDADWAGMAHSVEIRTPLVDVELFRKVAPLLALPVPPTKLDAAMSPGRPFNAELLRRPKTGFSIPVHEWSTVERPMGAQRQLRHWAQFVHRPFKRMRVLALLSDAFGGHGGIALHNRDLLSSLCAMPECIEVVALPRIIVGPLQDMPEQLKYVTQAANSKWRYAFELLKQIANRTHYDVIVCGHLNLLLLAVIAKIRLRAPIALFIHGIDAWQPRRFAKRFLIGFVDRVISVSDVTRERFQSWATLRDDKVIVNPNAIHTNWYGVGPKNPALVERHSLQGKTVLMTLGRLVSSERYKGFDEVLDVLPELIRDNPSLTYLIVGDGSDRARLERKARDLGIQSNVRFTGWIPEGEKADHYRLADAYVMPSRGEGFGFVLLEAMACGIPTVASKMDGGREALRNGLMGILVDPADPEDIKNGIREALQRPRGVQPTGLEFFAFEDFCVRTGQAIREVAIPGPGRPRDHEQLT